MDDSPKPIIEAGNPYQRPLRKMRRADIKVLLEDSVSGWTRHKTPRLGAALAFYTLLSLMPLLLIVISIAGLVFGPRAAQTGVLGQVQILIGSQRAKIVQALLEGAHSKAGGLLATCIGTLTLMFGASGVLMELRDALNTIWEVASPQLTTVQEIMGVVKGRLWSFALVLTIGSLLTGFLLLSSWISAIGTLYAIILPSHNVAFHVLNSMLSFVAVTAIFGAIYKIVPEVIIQWRDVILGAAVTSILFALGNLLLGLYLGKVSFSSTYGAAGSTIVLAVWVYYSSQIFFLGAEFTRAFTRRFGSGPPKSSQPLITTAAASSNPPGPTNPTLITSADARLN